MDLQIIERFKLFQSETGEFSDLDIETVTFDKLEYSNSGIFKFIKGQNKYIHSYIENNPGEIAELGASLVNDCIASYVKPISELDVISEQCVSFNKDNAKGSRAFYRDYPFVMDRHHIAIIPDKNIINVKYFQKCLDQFLILQKYGWGENVASVEELKKHSIPIPKRVNEKYNSLALQACILRFIEFFEARNNEQLYNIHLAVGNIQEIEQLFFPLFFKKDNSIAVRFDKFSSNKGIELKFDDIQFETKRVLSDNNDELVCTKRMGFTPERSSDGDISWFTVRDLTTNTSRFIDEPITKEKTTIDLVKKSISESSSKFSPIKRGDVLVSFKLTVGTTKIYNSDYPAYCNEAIDILTPMPNVNSQYLAYNCYNEYPKYGTKTNNGITLNDDDKKLISIRIPASTEKYTSLQLQNILVQFINEYLSKLESIKLDILKLESMFVEYNQTLIHKTFI